MDSNTTAYTKTFSIDLERANYHRKYKLKKRKRLLVVLLLWLLIFIYFITPLSKVNLRINGNVYYTKEELVNLGYINENRLWWLLDEKKVIKVLEAHEFINNVEIKKSFFGTKMKIEEIYPIGVYNNKYLLNNETIIEKNDYVFNNKITSITDFSSIDSSDLPSIAVKYSRVDLAIRDDFYKIELISDSYGYKYVKLYGSREDIGYFVIKVDLVYLDNKFKGNKYDKIIEEIRENNVKYSEDKPCLVAYHDMDENKFTLVDEFKEEVVHE